MANGNGATVARRANRPLSQQRTLVLRQNAGTRVFEYSVAQGGGTLACFDLSGRRLVLRELHEGAGALVVSQGSDDMCLWVLRDSAGRQVAAIRTSL